MRKYFISLLACCCMISAFPQELSKTKEVAFRAGEKLSYKMKYGFFTAAEADLSVEDSPIQFDSKPAYHIVAQGKTAGTFDVFYKVRNRYESYIDKNTLQPYFYAENRHESSYKHSDKVTFSQEKKTVTAAKGTFPYTADKVFDFVSAYYFARCI